jgi:exopolyphosphatase / guanosine-5'-triphosphate,3'-diphosphate pyrophosphatase
VRCACIDIGSNTTRLLVADVDARSGALEAVAQERVFTRLSAALTPPRPTIDSERIDELASVVAGQLWRARELGAERVVAVGTAALRRAGNREQLFDAIRGLCGLSVRLLDGDGEARLAFAGATRGLTGPAGLVAVVDVGGGSSELVCGDPRPSQRPELVFSASVAVGSGDLTAELLSHDPPSHGELAALRNRAAHAFAALAPPLVELALAVGGSATSLGRLAGPQLDRERLQQLLATVTAASSAEIARRHDLHRERARLLPAGIVLLQEASAALQRPLAIGAGGVREGVVLELANVA